MGSKTCAKIVFVTFIVLAVICFILAFVAAMTDDNIDSYVERFFSISGTPALASAIVFFSGAIILNAIAYDLFFLLFRFIFIFNYCIVIQNE